MNETQNELSSNNTAKSTSKSIQDANIACLDTSFNYLFFNDTHKTAVREAWGVKLTPGMSPLDIIPEQDYRDAVRNNLMRAMKGETFTEIREYGDIERNTWESNYSPMYSPDGQISGINVISYNISELQQQDRRSEEQEKKYKHLFENMTEGFALIEMINNKQGVAVDYRILEVNKAYEKQTGLRASDIVGKRILDVDPDFEKSWIEYYGEIARTKTTKFFVHFNQNTGKYYETSVFSLERGEVVLLFRDITQRKMAQDDLVQSEAQFRALFEQASGNCMILDPNTPDGIPVIVDANEAALSAHGYSREEFIGRPVTVIDDEDGRRLAKQRAAEIMADGSIYVENEHVRKDGSTFSVAVNANRIDVGDSQLILTSEYDITTRKQATELENRTSAILKMIATGASSSRIYDAIGRMYEDRHNGMRCSMLELKGNKLRHGGAPSLPKEYCDAVDGLEYGPSVGSCGTSTFTGKQVLVEDIATDPKWAKIKHVALPHGLRCCWSEPIKNPAGKVLGAFGMYYNHPALPNDHELADLESAAVLTGIVMEREQREANLRILSEAIEQAGEAVLITDTVGTIEYVNPAFTKMTGYTVDEALGENPRILKSYDLTDEYYKNLWNIISEGQVFNDTIVVRRKDGSQYSAIISIAPIFDSAGIITHYVGLQQDMTEYEILEEQFRQAQKLEALGTLVGGIAHDFNNMLAGITGNLYLAKQLTKDNPNVSEKLNNAEGLSFRAAEMIQQLLTFARKNRVNMEQLALRSFMNETFKLLSASIRENITINLEVCADELHIKGDAIQIHQILLNLVNNACDAVESNADPRINIKLEAVELDEALEEKHSGISPGLYAHLSIEDNGCGIPEASAEHIFEPFFTTKEVGKGSGLGLAMVFGAVNSHHGFIDVESVENKGSKFNIYLPVVEADNVAIQSRSNSTATEKGSGETILLVDDQSGVIETGKQVLESMGYKVLTAPNGKEAVAVFKQHAETIALIIMDIIMPVMSGDKAAKLIRKINPGARIIFATGYDKGAQVKTKNEVVISKPFEVEKLSELIRDTIDSK